MAEPAEFVRKMMRAQHLESPQFCFIYKHFKLFLDFNVLPHNHDYHYSNDVLLHHRCPSPSENDTQAT